MVFVNVANVAAAATDRRNQAAKITTTLMVGESGPRMLCKDSQLDAHHTSSGLICACAPQRTNLRAHDSGSSSSRAQSTTKQANVMLSRLQRQPVARCNAGNARRGLLLITLSMQHFSCCRCGRVVARLRDVLCDNFWLVRARRTTTNLNRRLGRIK